MDSKSGAGQNEPRPLTVTVLAIQPSPAKTPWWARRAKLHFSHIVISIGDVIWDQPFKGTACAYDADVWVVDHDVIERGFTRVDLTFPDHDPWMFMAACKYIEGRKSQRLRTCLRWLKLWSSPAWNCTTPIRVLLRALDPALNLTGETPDQIIEELTRQD